MPNRCTGRSVTPRRDHAGVQVQQRLPLVGDTGAAPGRPADGDWRIDEPTRLAGRRGLAAARAALARSTPAGPTERAHAA